MRGGRGASSGTSSARGKRERVAALCLALPHAEHADLGDHAIYRVRGKVFAYFLDNHHGDGIVSVCVKAELGENSDRARLAPLLYYLPAHIGSRGWYGMRLDRGRVAWREVAAVIERSYRLTAPAGCVAKLDAARGALDNRPSARRAGRSRG
jgi:predicted DNA-binding protein (MmcQ/YjbR family)